MAKRVTAKNPALSIADAAERTGTSQSTIRRRIADGELRAYRLGSRTIRIDESDLARAFTEVNPATFSKVSGGDAA